MSGPALVDAPPQRSGRRWGARSRASGSSPAAAAVLAGTALLGVGLVAVVGYANQIGHRGASGAQGPAPVVAGPGATPAERAARLQDRLREHPRDASGWAALGAAYVEVARVSGDPSQYPKAEEALRRSLDLQPQANVPALIGMAALANARHDFASALGWAERARAVSPDEATVWGPLADALIELGRYDEGFDAIQRMVDLEPSLASYARVSYGRELQGDVDGAVDALEAAAGVAPGRSERAFAIFQLGELHWNSGRLDDAVAAYRQAAALDPGAIAPEAGLARAAWAQGRTEKAIATFERVVERLPLPQYITELADLYTISGQPERAAEQRTLLEAQERILVANGVNVEVEAVLHSADHGIGLAEGLAAARAEWNRRQSVFAADALAWQLHANGHQEEALAMADQALRLGTANALFHFHRSQIRLAVGDLEGGRADLARAANLNPHFSILHARSAAEQLAQLQSAA